MNVKNKKITLFGPGFKQVYPNVDSFSLSNQGNYMNFSYTPLAWVQDPEPKRRTVTTTLFYMIEEQD